MDRHRPRSDSAAFVGLAAAAAAASSAFEPLGGLGARAGHDGGFRPFHDTGADFGVADNAADMPVEFPVDMDLPADDGATAGAWDGEFPSGGALEDAETFDMGEAPRVGGDLADTVYPDVDAMQATGETDAENALGSDERIAALIEQHDRELEALRAEYGELAAERIRAGLAAIEQQLLDGIGAQVARILEPVLGSQARERSVVAFTEALREMLTDSDVVSVRVEGPPDLMGRVEAALGSADARLEFRAAQTADLRAQVADSVIMTRLGEWADELAGAIDARG